MEFEDGGLPRFFSLTSPFLDERQRRLLAASMVAVLGRGGQARVAVASGMSRSTLIAGAKELAERPELGERVRRRGAGPKRKIDLDPDLVAVLDSLVEPGSRGDPTNPLRWTWKSTRVLAAELTGLGHKVGANLVGDLLHDMGYKLEAKATVAGGAQHAEWDRQFRYVNDTAVEHLVANQPVISVDTKQMTFDGEANDCWAKVGDNHDTPAFAVASIARWWERMGRVRHPGASRLMVAVDTGRPGSYRSRAFPVELSKLASTIGIAITVCHMPPGTVKWEIEHRLFDFIAMNWRGKPLTTYRTVVDLIATTTIRRDLNNQADIDAGSDPTGMEFTFEQLHAVTIEPHHWHPEWNYTILPP